MVLVRETIAEGAATLLRYLFVGTRGEPVALLEGPAVAPGAAFVPKRAQLLAETPEANNGMQIRYTDFHQSLAAGATGFLQYSVQANTALSALNPAWTTVASMISIDQTNVPYPPDPGDPGSTQILPEVWDFTGLVRATIPYRTFNSTRNDAGGGPCLSACATANAGRTHPTARGSRT